MTQEGVNILVSDGCKDCGLVRLLERLINTQGCNQNITPHDLLDRVGVLEAVTTELRGEVDALNEVMREAL